MKSCSAVSSRMLPCSSSSASSPSSCTAAARPSAAGSRRAVRKRSLSMDCVSRTRRPARSPRWSWAAYPRSWSLWSPNSVSALSVSAARTEISSMSRKNMQTDRISALSAKSLTSIPKFSLTCLRKTICRSSRPWAWMMISIPTISMLMRRRVPLPVPCAPTNLSI